MLKYFCLASLQDSLLEALQLMIVNIYVIHSRDSQVIKLTLTGSEVWRIGSFGPGDSQFNSSYGITVDGSGNVYVADTYNDRIRFFEISEAPAIISFNPFSPLTDNAGAIRTFNITANRIVNVIWSINGTQVQLGFVHTGSPVKRIKLARDENSMNNNSTNMPVHSLSIDS